MYNVADFYKLGLGEPFPISSANGSGTGDLLDEIVKDLPADDTEEEHLEEIPKVLPSWVAQCRQILDNQRLYRRRP